LLNSAPCNCIRKDSKVCTVGIWHLGSVYSACFAELGYSVMGVDRDQNRVDHLNKGVPPLFEPGLEELILKNIHLNRLSYTVSLRDALVDASFVLIAFDTRVDENDDVDLCEVYDTAAELAEYLENYSIIIVSSQVPVGTCEEIKSLIRQKRPSLDVDVAYVPENLRLGQAIEGFMNPDRIVIGADNEDTLDRVEAFFSVVKAPKIRMNLRSAEMTKHALNAFLATSISFINEIANLCDEVGADALKVAEAMRLDSRIGPKAMLKPGLGFAGGTLARDLKVLQKLGGKSCCPTRLIDGVLRVNQRQNHMIAGKLRKVCGSLQNLTVGVLGLTYKAGTSTLRRSASLEIIRDLADGGARVKAYDPKADLREIQGYTEFEFCSDELEVASGSDALVFVTDWPEFKELDFSRIKSLMKKPVVIDAQNMLDTERLVQMGFIYLGVGRGRGFQLAGKGKK
jgi:UDPglucose 6-dehydrogenase